MSTGLIIRFVLMALVLIVWAVMVLRLVSNLRARAAAKRQSDSAGFLTEMAGWMRAPEDQPERRSIGFLTFVLLAMIAVEVLTPA